MSTTSPRTFAAPALGEIGPIDKKLNHYFFHAYFSIQTQFSPTWGRSFIVTFDLKMANDPLAPYLSVPSTYGATGFLAAPDPNY